MACIICGSTELLNTNFTLKIDERQVSVQVCDQCADDATTKIVREAYISKMAKFDDLCAAAAIIGYKLVPIEDVVVAQPATTTQPIVENTQLEQPARAHNPNVLKGADAKRVINRTSPTASGDGIPAGMSPYNRDLDDSAEVELGSAVCAGGAPITIPKRISDAYGTTKISIVRTNGNDIVKPPEDGIVKYDLRDCPLCRGDGEIKNGQEMVTCPKCGGRCYI